MLVVIDIMVAQGVEWQLSTGQLVALVMNGDQAPASEIAHIVSSSLVHYGRSCVSSTVCACPQQRACLCCKSVELAANSVRARENYRGNSAITTLAALQR
jgi:hypothetical protein